MLRSSQLERITFLAAMVLASAAALAYDGVCDSRAELEALPPGHWCEIANTPLESAEKKPEEFPDFDGANSEQYQSFQRNMGIQGVTRAWNSAAMDTRRNRLLVAGGGHNAYGGNEVYAFDLDTIQWTRLTDPTPFPNRGPDYKNDDGTPISRHTYGGLLYIDSEDALFLFGGAPDSQSGGCGVSGAWLLDLSALEEEPYTPSHWTELSAENEPDPLCDDFAAYDRAGNRVLYGTKDSWYEMDMETKTWSRIKAESRGRLRFSYMGAAPRLNLLVHVGGGYTAYRDMSDPMLPRREVEPTGDTSITETERPGVAFDPVTQLIVSYHGGGDVFLLDPDADLWIRQAPDEGNVYVPGEVTTAGVYGRFAYSEPDDLFIYVNRVDENVIAYRLDRSKLPERPRAPVLSVE